MSRIAASICILACACAGGVGQDGDNPGLSSSGATETETASDSANGSTPSGSSPSATEPASDADSDSGTSAGTTSGSTATTQSSCLDTWRTQVPGVFVEELALGPDDQVLLVGNSDDLQGARLFGFDRCTGEQTLEMSLDHPGADETGVYDIAVDGAAVYVAGNVVVDGDDEGYLVKLEGSPLSISFTQPLAGSTGADEIFDLGVDDGGRVWLSGITPGAEGPTAWIVSSDSEGQYCSFTWSGTGPSYAKGLAITGQSVGVLIENEGSLVEALYDSSNCTCDCSPDVQSQPIALGSNSSHVGAGVLLDGQVYLAAYATDTDAPGDIYGVLAWIDQNGALVDTYTYDATAAGDGFIQIATDGQTLFVAGLDGWTGGSFDNAEARLEAFDVPLAANAQPLWSGAPDGLNVIPGLAAEQGGAGGLFAAGNITGEGVIVRCDKSGTCG